MSQTTDEENINTEASTSFSSGRRLDGETEDLESKSYVFKVQRDITCYRCDGKGHVKCNCRN